MNEEAPERGLFFCRKNLKGLLGDFGQICRQNPPNPTTDLAAFHKIAPDPEISRFGAISKRLGQNIRERVWERF